jgi:signal peptidase I
MNHYTINVEKKTNFKPGRTILLAFIFAIVLKLFCFDFVIVEGNSMLPTLKPGSVLFVNRSAYGFRFPWMKNYLVSWNVPEKNDIVIFVTPMGHIAVKRCSEIIAKTQFIALGDNADDSLDSRSYGPVPIDNILGKVSLFQNKLRENSGL